MRDLLGRGNPGNVYRMTIGKLPYDTVVYPPAVQAGSSASLRIIGKDTEGTDTNFTVSPINTLGLTSVGSPYGAQQIYVSGYTVTHEKSVTAPTCVTGQLAKSGATDTFTVQGDGAFDFEAFSERLGSSVPVRCRLFNNKGQNIARSDRDERMNAKLVAGQNYTLKVEAGYGEFEQVQCVYAVEIRPVHPVADVAIRPANITVRPGMSTAIEAVVLRREDITGDITVSAENLPSGVIVTPAIIQPDRNEARLILTCMSTAQPAERPISITVSATGRSGEVRANATPQEIVLLQNQPTPITRSECVLAVRGQSDFTGEVTSGSAIKVHPRRGVKVTVKVKRTPAFKGAVNVRIVNLPLGWVANQEQIPADKDTVTMLVRPDGNNTQPFLTRDPKLSPIYATVEMGADEYFYSVGSLLVNKADNISDKDE